MKQQVMKRYVEQLMEDIDLAKRNAERRLSSYFECDHSAAYHLVDDESDEAGIKISDLIGLEVFVFPKSEHLREGELLDLSDAMIALLQNYGFNPMFGSYVPYQIKYSLMRRAFNHRVYPGENQMVDLELCDYLPQYCPLYNLCSHYNAHKVCCELKRRA